TSGLFSRIEGANLCQRLLPTVRYRTEKRRSGSGQLQHRDLRSGTEPDGGSSYANSAVHVELRATVFVQSPDVGYPYQAAEVEPAVDEIKRQLATAMNVASERQVDAQLGLIEALRVMD